jgi:long-chain acyl-CoA synthetase
MMMRYLYEHAEVRPDHLAVVYRDERIGFGELVERIEKLAAGLADRGIGPGDAVALLLPNDPSFVVSWHAVTGLGAIVVPVNPSFKQDELEFTFRRSDIKAVISDERTAGVCERIVAGFDRPVEVIPTSDAHGPSLTLDMLIEGSTPARLEERSPDEVYLFQFSSGSTGRPKRVPRTHAQCVAEGELYNDTFGRDPEDKVFCAIPMFHTYGMGACLFWSATSGATMVILEDPNPFLLRRHRALELIEQERATVFPGVPFNFRLMAEAPAGADLTSLRLVFSAGTALPRPSFEAFGERFGLLVRQLYGSTEAGLMTVNLDPDPVATFESVGTPAGDVEIRIADEDGDTLPPGEGEVLVNSPAMTDGYSDLEELNREAFQDGYFHTGDLGRLDDEGRLYLTGRKKLLIEVGGYKVDPIEVQDVVIAHPKVREAVVVGAEGRVEGEELVKAVVVPNEDFDDRELVEFCRERLANFKVPQIVEFREEIPKSPLGKVLRKYLV